MTSTFDLPYELKTPFNKSSWPEGPWSYEPDISTFTSHGLACAVIRMPWGSLNGYVRVAEDHPIARGLLSTDDLSVHGGVTYDYSKSPWHWIGFDCSHSGDYVIGYEKYIGMRESTYRTISYVTAETRALAKQLSEIKRPSLSPTFTLSSEGLFLLREYFRSLWDEDKFEELCAKHLSPKPDFTV